MNSVNVLKRVAGVLVAGLAWCAMADAPVISDVVVRQRWPWSRLVDIDYVLTGDPTDRMDVLVTAKDGSVDLVLPPNSLSGDLFGVVPGVRRIIFDPTKTVYTNSQMLTQFSVTLTPIVTPLYMIVDLTKAVNAEGHIQYVYEEDLTNGVWGTWERNPVSDRGAGIESVIWTGVTNDYAYKSDKLVLRRVPAGTYFNGDNSGSQPPNVTLSSPMYASVFVLTRAQHTHIMGVSEGGAGDLPSATRAYIELRGYTNEIGEVHYDWPNTGRAVDPLSLIGKLRSKTGFTDFDLPTEAQWEYLCRAGTTTAFHDGNDDAMISGAIENNNGYTNMYLDVVGWYKFSETVAIQPVGQKRPNAWGFYDIHGNVWEPCLDWWNGARPSGIDPVGPISGTTRARRSGAFDRIALECRSANRRDTIIDQRRTDVGVRVVRTLSQ